MEMQGATFGLSREFPEDRVKTDAEAAGFVFEAMTDGIHWHGQTALWGDAHERLMGNYRSTESGACVDTVVPDGGAGFLHAGVLRG